MGRACVYLRYDSMSWAAISIADVDRYTERSHALTLLAEDAV